MMRRGPASVFWRKSDSSPVVEDCPDRFRPPPCIPDDDPVVGSAGRMTGRYHRPATLLGWCRLGLRGSIRAPRRALQRLVTRHTGMVRVGRDLLDLLNSPFYFGCYFIIHRRYFIIELDCCVSTHGGV